MKDMRKNKKKWVLPLMTGASIILSFSGVIHAQNQSDLDKPLLRPLPPNDPAAQLDSSLLNVPAKPMPKEGIPPTTPSTQSLAREVSYDIRSRSTQVGAIRRPPTPSQSTSFSPANLGADANVKPSREGEPPSPGRIPPQTLYIGTDDRQLITDTTAYPWRTITKLYITFPDGSKFSCSGALISAKYVLTAGHCIHDPSNGGWATDIQVIPGLYGTYKPYGSAFATNIRSYTGWITSRNSNYDFALVTLDRNIGNSTGWLGYAYYTSLNGVIGNIGGYPGDRDGGLGLYYDSGPVVSSTAQRVNYQIYTASGESGSGVYRINNNERYVFAVHTNGGITYNSGTRIDSQKYNDLRKWVATGK